MHLLHVTQDGERMFIGQMSEQHLRNTINFILVRIERGLAIGGGTAVVTPKQAAVLGLDLDRIQEDEREQISDRLQALYPYVAEAVLRWEGEEVHAQYMSGLRDRLRGVMDRTGKMEPLSLTEDLPDELVSHPLVASSIGVNRPESEKRKRVDLIG